MFLHIEHIIMFHVINDFAYGIYSLFSPPNENWGFFSPYPDFFQDYNVAQDSIL